MKNSDNSIITNSDYIISKLRHFMNENAYRVNKHVKKYSASSGISKMQIKATVRYPYTFISVSKK